MSVFKIGHSVLARLEGYPMKYLLALLIVLLIPTAALAKGECKEERKKFCAGMVKKELWDCLSKYEAELGAPCKTKIEARAKAKEERAKEKAENSPAEPSAPSAASANYSLPSTDTQPQPSYPDGKTQ
jgi:hypothetical protein